MTPTPLRKDESKSLKISINHSINQEEAGTAPVCLSFFPGLGSHALMLLINGMGGGGGGGGGRGREENLRRVRGGGSIPS